MNDFLQRLRERKLVQWALAYAAGTWVLLQVLSLMSGTYHWSDAVMRIAFVVAIIGFFITLVLSWYHGERGEQRVAAGEVAILLVLLALAGGMTLWTTAVTPPTNLQPGAVPAIDAPASATSGSAQIPDIEKDPSIAVLPFADLSRGHDQEYFSDGISEELLNLLAKVPKLRVIARTSSFSFKGRQVAISDIARALHVAAVLQGSIRKSDDKVRITVQLIRASDSSQLWSEDYDRTLDDIFKVQDEIAAAVVDKLKITLLGAVPTVKPIDPKAYQLILQAEALGGQGSAPGRAQALLLYQQALTIAPDNVRILEGLAQMYLNQALIGERSRVEGFRLGREALNQVLAIDPDDANAHSYLGWIASHVDGDMTAAAKHYQRALDVAPADTTVINNAAIFVRNLGRQDEAIALFIRAVANDPADPIVLGNLGLSYYYADRWDQAISSSRTALNLSPGIADVHCTIGTALLVGKDDAAGALKEMQAEPDEITRMTGLALAYHALGQKSESDTALAALIAKHENDAAIFIAAVLAYRGEPDRAFEWLDKAAATRDPNLPDVFHDPLIAKLHHDPRWLPFLRRIGEAPEQLAKIELKVTLPGQEAPR